MTDDDFKGSPYPLSHKTFAWLCEKTRVAHNVAKRPNGEFSSSQRSVDQASVSLGFGLVSPTEYCEQKESAAHILDELEGHDHSSFGRRSFQFMVQPSDQNIGADSD